MNYDENQTKIVEKLNAFYSNFEILKEEETSFVKKRQSFFSRFFNRKQNNNPQQEEIQLKGIYLWGGVGCGVRKRVDEIY